jgi:hypothetical protein
MSNTIKYIEEETEYYYDLTIISYKTEPTNKEEYLYELLTDLPSYQDTTYEKCIEYIDSKYPELDEYELLTKQY